MNEWNNEIKNEIRPAISAPKAEEMGKWLGLLFWLVIPTVAGSAMSHQAVTAFLPFLYLPGRIISMAALCIYGYALLKLSSESRCYRMAAMCCLLSVAVDAAISLIPEGFTAAPLIGLLSFPVVILAFYGEYAEYMGHSEVLQVLDEEMSLKWKRLWKWYMYSLAAVIASVPVTMVSAVLGITVLLAAMAGTLIVSVLKLMYLYRTAKIFREFAREDR